MPLSNQNEVPGVSFATYSGWRSYLDGRNGSKKTADSTSRSGAPHSTRDRSNNRHKVRSLVQKSVKNYSEGIVHNTSGKPSASASTCSPEESDSCASLASVRSLPIGGTISAQLLTRNSHDLCGLKSFTNHVTTDCGYIDATIRPYMYGRNRSGALGSGLPMAGTNHAGSSSLTSLARDIIGNTASLGGVNSSSCSNMGGGNRNRVPRVAGCFLNDGRGNNTKNNNSNNNNCFINMNGANQYRFLEGFGVGLNKGSGCIEIFDNSNNSNNNNNNENCFINMKGSNQGRDLEVFCVGLNKESDCVEMFSNDNCNNCNIYSCERLRDEGNIDRFKFADNDFSKQSFELSMLNTLKTASDSLLVDNVLSKDSDELENRVEVYNWNQSDTFQCKNRMITGYDPTKSDYGDCLKTNGRGGSSVPMMRAMSTGFTNNSVDKTVTLQIKNTRKVGEYFLKAMVDKTSTKEQVEKSNTPMLWTTSDIAIHSASKGNSYVNQNRNNNSTRSSFSSSSGSDSITTSCSTSYPVNSARLPYDKRLTTDTSSESSEVEGKKGADSSLYDADLEEYSQSPLSTASSSAEPCSSSSNVTDSACPTRVALETSENIPETLDSCFSHKSIEDNNRVPRNATIEPFMVSDGPVEKKEGSSAGPLRQARTRSFYEGKGNGRNHRAKHGVANSERKLNAIAKGQPRWGPNGARPERAKGNNLPGMNKAERHNESVFTMLTDAKAAHKVGSSQISVPKVPNVKGERQPLETKPETQAQISCTNVDPANTGNGSNGSGQSTMFTATEHTPTVNASNIITPINAMCSSATTKESDAIILPKPNEMPSPKEPNTGVPPQPIHSTKVQLKRPSSNITLQNRFCSPPQKTRRANSLSGRKTSPTRVGCKEVKPNKPRSFTNAPYTPGKQKLTNESIHRAVTLELGSTETGVKCSNMSPKLHPMNAQEDTPCTAELTLIESPTSYSALCQARAAEYAANLRQTKLNATQRNKKIRPVNSQQHHSNSTTFSGFKKYADTPQGKLEKAKFSLHENIPSKEIKRASVENRAEPHGQTFWQHARPNPTSLSPSVNEPNVPNKFNLEQSIRSPKGCWLNQRYPQARDQKCHNTMKQQCPTTAKVMRLTGPEPPRDTLELKDKTEQWVLNHMQMNSGKTVSSGSTRARTRPSVCSRIAHSHGSRRSHCVKRSTRSNSGSANSGMAPPSDEVQLKQLDFLWKSQQMHAQNHSSTTVKKTSEEISAPVVEVIYSAPKSVRPLSCSSANKHTTPTVTTKAMLNCLNPGMRSKDSEKYARQRLCESLKKLSSTPSRDAQLKPVEIIAKGKENHKLGNEEAINRINSLIMPILGSAKLNMSILGTPRESSHGSNIRDNDNNSENGEKDQMGVEKPSDSQKQVGKKHTAVDEKIFTNLKLVEQDKQNPQLKEKRYPPTKQSKLTDSSGISHCKQVKVDDTMKSPFKTNVAEGGINSPSTQGLNSSKQGNLKYSAQMVPKGNDIPEVLHSIQSCKNPTVFAGSSNIEATALDSFQSPAKALKSDLVTDAPSICNDDDPPSGNQQGRQVNESSEVSTNVSCKDAVLSCASAILDSSWPPTKTLSIDSDAKTHHCWTSDQKAMVIWKTNAIRKESLNLKMGKPFLENYQYPRRAPITKSRSIPDFLKERSMTTTKHRCSAIRQYIQKKYGCLRHKSVPCDRIISLFDHKKKIRELRPPRHGNIDTSKPSDEYQMKKSVENNTIESSSKTSSESIPLISNTPQYRVSDNNDTKDISCEKDEGWVKFKTSNFARDEKSDLTKLGSSHSLPKDVSKSTESKVKKRSLAHKKSKNVRAQKGPPLLSLSAYDSLITELKTHYLLERLASLDKSENIVEEEQEEGFTKDWDEWSLDDKSFDLPTELNQSEYSREPQGLTPTQLGGQKSVQDPCTFNQLVSKYDGFAAALTDRKRTCSFLHTEPGVSCKRSKVLQTQKVVSDFKANVAAAEVSCPSDLTSRALSGVKNLYLEQQIATEVCPHSESGPGHSFCSKKEDGIGEPVNARKPDNSDHASNKSSQTTPVEVSASPGVQQPPSCTPLDLSICSSLITPLNTPLITPLNAPFNTPLYTCHINDSVTILEKPFFYVSGHFMEVSTKPNITQHADYISTEPVDLTLKNKSQKGVYEISQTEPLDLSVQEGISEKRCPPDGFQNNILENCLRQVVKESCDEAGWNDDDDDNDDICKEPIDHSKGWSTEVHTERTEDTSQETSKNLDELRRLKIKQDRSGNHNACHGRKNSNLVQANTDQFLSVVSVFQDPQPKKISMKNSQETSLTYNLGNDIRCFQNLACDSVPNVNWHFMSHNLCRSALYNSLLEQSGPCAFWKIALNLSLSQPKPERRSGVQLDELGNEPLQSIKGEQKEMLEKAGGVSALCHRSLLIARNESNMQRGDSDCSFSQDKDRNGQCSATLRPLLFRESQTTTPSSSLSHQSKAEISLIQMRQNSKGGKSIILYATDSCLIPVIPPVHPNPCLSIWLARNSGDLCGDNSDFSCISDSVGGEDPSCKQTVSSATLLSSSNCSVSLSHPDCDLERQVTSHPRAAVSVDSDSSFHSCSSICNMSSSQS